MHIWLPLKNKMDSGKVKTCGPLGMGQPFPTYRHSIRVSSLKTRNFLSWRCLNSRSKRVCFRDAVRYLRWKGSGRKQATTWVQPAISKKEKVLFQMLINSGFKIKSSLLVKRKSNRAKLGKIKVRLLANFLVFWAQSISNSRAKPQQSTRISCKRTTRGTSRIVKLRHLKKMKANSIKLFVNFREKYWTTIKLVLHKKPMLCSPPFNTSKNTKLLMLSLASKLQ